MDKNLNINYNYLLSYIKIYIIIQIIHPIFLNKCENRDNPILNENECKSIYCTNEEYNFGTCQIDNPIIKIQWLSNIIQIGDKNYRYFTYAQSKKNELIIETTSFPENNLRKFYCITAEEWNCFINKNEPSNHFYYVNVSDKNGTFREKYEGEAIFIQLTDNNTEFYKQEYFLSLSINNGFTELFDFENNKIFALKTNTFYSSIIYSGIGSILQFKTNNNSENYYIFSYIINENNTYYFELKKYIFLSLDISSVGFSMKSKIKYESSDRKIVSCYETEHQKIVCLYQNLNYEFKISVHSENFKLIAVSTLGIEVEGQNNTIFFKCIHLKNEVGVFIYFNSILFDYPIMSLKEFNEETSSIITFNNLNLIELNYASLNSHFLYNDIIKINDEKFCFSSTSIDKEKLYILVANLYNLDENLLLNYYKINLFELYNHKILSQLKLILYNNQHVSLLFNNCQNKDCDSNNTGLYTSFIIFNYPNSTNFVFDVIDHLNKTKENINNMTLNFKENIKIENNLFGYIIKGIKILNHPNNTKLFFANNDTEINDGDIFNNVSIQLSLLSFNSIYNITSISITFALVLTEPDLEEFEKYPNFIDNIDGIFSQNENFILKKEDYIGKVSYLKILIKNNLVTICNNENCNLCFEKLNNKCISCNYDFNYKKGVKNCLNKDDINDNEEEEENDKETSENYEQKNNDIIIVEKECTNDDIINNQCNGTITNEQAENLNNYLKSEIQNGTYKNESLIIQTQNVDYQIDTSSNQKIISTNKTSIDLGLCEKIIKEKENIPEDVDLIIYIINNKNEDSTKNYIQYEVYNPYTLLKINLEICKNFTVTLNIPKTTNSTIDELYDILDEYGYNIFNINDSFYNDVCTAFNTKNNTDMIISDRQNDIYIDIVNEYLYCQENCTVASYNITTKIIQCDCPVQTTEIISNPDNIKFYSKLLIKSFSTSIKNSNFLVMKCYKYLFSSKGIKNNMGFFMFIILLIIYLICFVVYCFTGQKNIKKMVEYLIHSIFNMKKNRSQENLIIRRKIKNMTLKSNNNDNIIIKRSRKKTKTFDARQRNNLLNNDKIYIDKKKKKIRIKKKLNDITDKSIDISSSKNGLKNDILLKYNSGSILKNRKNKNDSNCNIKKKKISRQNPPKKRKKSEKSNDFSEISGKDNSKNSDLEHKNLTDEELNALDYKNALKLDKREYCEYYISLLKKKSLLLFVFFRNKDYNLVPVKISLFVVILSFNFCSSCFFFSDSALHKLYKEFGKYDFIYNIPQLIYSVILSALFRIFLFNLSLTASGLLKIKYENNVKSATNKSKEFIQNMKIRLFFYFLSSFIFMLFFCYFISCFCAVFHNAQKTLFKDTFISFGSSIFIRFILYLFPGFFRIQAIRAIKKDKDCLYKFSQILAFL